MHTACLFGENVIVFGGFDRHCCLDVFVLDISKTKQSATVAGKKYSRCLSVCTDTKVHKRERNRPSGASKSLRFKFWRFYFQVLTLLHECESKTREDVLSIYVIIPWSDGWKWEQKEVTGKPPSARYAHSSTEHGTDMIVFGGWDGQRTNDVHILDTGEFAAVMYPFCLKKRTHIRFLCIFFCSAFHFCNQH